MITRIFIVIYDLTNRNKLWIVPLLIHAIELKGYGNLFNLNSILSCFSWLSRIVLAAVFMYGGIPKLFAPGDFAAVISAYGLLPDSLIFPAAIILPLAEVATAIGLLLNCRWGMISAILLLLVFIAVLSYGDIAGS